MDIARLLEFMSNHPFLFAAIGVTVGFLVYTEYNRIVGGVKSVSPYQATQLLNGGEAMFVDVRDDAEFKKGHVLEATNIPLSALDQRLHELEKYKDKDVVIYCDSGMRSQKAGAKLKKNGFSKMHTMAGGLAAWEKSSLPLVTK